MRDVYWHDVVCYKTITDSGAAEMMPGVLIKANQTGRIAQSDHSHRPFNYSGNTNEERKSTKVSSTVERMVKLGRNRFTS